ncbi:MAG: Na/Pi cotransporter family protein [Leptospiraceae bacterium]|nr:Na/Pi cotransporter family protein [Leptospiraceae bacterium]
MPETPSVATIEIGALITGLGGGLALFLYGMRQMTEALKTVAGNRMKNLLGRLTANRFSAALAGTVITAIIQSSSVTTVLVVGFVSAGLLTLNQSIGVILGAHLGTTITAQIIAFQIYRYGLLLIAIGFLMDLVGRNEKIKHWGMVLLGLGLIFFGMELMSGVTSPLREWAPFAHAVGSLQHPLAAVGVGLLFTAVIQSSSATTGVVIVLAAQGLLSLETGIALAFGANIGTCVTAIIAAIGRPREAVQAALIHVLFNTTGVLLWLPWIGYLAALVRTLSPGDLPRQIANAHTLFNLGNLCLFIWLTAPMARLVQAVAPLKLQAPGIRALYLDQFYLEQPSLALDQVRRELTRVAMLAREMLRRVLQVTIEGSDRDIADLQKLDRDLDSLQGEIITYLASLSQRQLIDPQPGLLSRYLSIANYLENLGDVIRSNFMENARKRLSRQVSVSASTRKVLGPLHQEVCRAFDSIVTALEQADLIAARDAADSKTAVGALADRASSHLAKRLAAGEPNRLLTFHLETDTVENLKRLNTLTRRIGRVLLEIDPNAQTTESRETSDSAS